MCILLVGILPPAAVQQMSSRGKDINKASPPVFYACGVSLVFHPINPNAPTVHANYRYFEVEGDKIGPDGKKEIIWWFGGTYICIYVPSFTMRMAVYLKHSMPYDILSLYQQPQYIMLLYEQMTSTDYMPIMNTYGAANI